MQKTLIITLIVILCFSCFKASHEDQLKSNSIPKDSLIQVEKNKFSVFFKDTIVSNNITHIIEFNKSKQILKISTNASIYLLDSISVDKILDIEVLNRNKEKDTDLLIYCDYDMAIVGHLYRLKKNKTQFKKVKKHENHYSFIPVNEKEDLYCDFMPYGCNWNIWTSALYKIRGTEIIKLGHIIYDECEYHPNSKEFSKFTVEVHKKDKILFKSDDYESDIAKKIRTEAGLGESKYWEINVEQFLK